MLLDLVKKFLCFRFSPNGHYWTENYTLLLKCMKIELAVELAIKRFQRLPTENKYKVTGC